LRWIVEKPGEEVSEAITESGENFDKGEIGDTYAEVATEKKCEAKQGRGGVEIFGVGVEPGPGGIKIEKERGGIESANGVEHRENLE